MKKIQFIIASYFLIFANHLYAQNPQQLQSDMMKPDAEIMHGLDLNSMETSFILNVNPMSAEKREMLNRVASDYRSRNRSLLASMGFSMLAGGTSAIINVVATEIVNLTKLRSKQKKAWEQMRQSECLFIDSLQSVKGQSDFYREQSNYGPLDPSNMNFDGITLKANRNGREVLYMVCHIDTTKFYHMFLHSKFYLVVDSIVFHPYHSFLPNWKAIRVNTPQKSMASQEDIDYWNTIKQFSFDEFQTPTINIKMDIYSSWINELVQVYQDVKLGTFTLNMPINEDDLRDSVYIYSRAKAIAENLPVINMDGDCFVVPRSYMPVSANNPSWGTGEYKMRVILSERCRYNPQGNRAKKWHRDYKQLVKMQNNGKAKNEYWNEIVSTFRDNGTTILKATYTPLVNSVTTLIGSAGTDAKSGMMGGAAMKGGASAGLPAGITPGK